MTKEKGLRYNEGKLRWSLLPLDSIKEILKVLEYGAKKYKPYNLEIGLSFSETFDSLMRHLNSWYQEGEDFDKETGIHHLAHAGCNVFFLLSFVIRGNRYKKFDDRPKFRKEKR